MDTKTQQAEDGTELRTTYTFFFSAQVIFFFLISIYWSRAFAQKKGDWVWCQRQLYRPGYANHFPFLLPSFPSFSLFYELRFSLSLLMLVPHVFIHVYRCSSPWAQFLVSSPCIDSPSLRLLMFHAAETQDCCCDSDENSLLFEFNSARKTFDLPSEFFVYFSLISVLACFSVAISLLSISNLLNCF